MNVLVASDKFKGSLTAWEACSAIKEGVLLHDPSAKVVTLPLADGGEGTLEILEPEIGFQRVELTVSGPLFEEVDAWYGLKGKVAYIEMAKASGLLLLDKENFHAPSTTTLGTGELIMDALQRGAKKIYLFVGGSATNDGGVGMAKALGYRFLNSNEEELKPIGASLENIHTIENLSLVEIDNVEFIVVTDVQNPLYGENGAANVFARQKGASEIEVEKLDLGLQRLNEVAIKKWGKDVSDIPGAGAAGGIGAGAMLFLHAQVQSGITTIMDIVNFNKYLEDTDVVIAGEGKFDAQTLKGKVIKGVMDKCELAGKPLGIVCGTLEFGEKQLSRLPIKSVVSIKEDTIHLDDAIKNAFSHLVKISQKLVSQLNK